MSSHQFTKVAPALWRSARFLALDCIAQVLHLYYLSCKHQNSSGCISLPDGYACQDLKWDLEKYVAARNELVKAELITWDPATSEIYVNRWFKHCPPMNPKHADGIENLISQIESDLVRQKVEGEFNAVAARPREASSRAPLAQGNAHLTKTPFLTKRSH